MRRVIPLALLATLVFAVPSSAGVPVFAPPRLIEDIVPGLAGSVSGSFLTVGTGGQVALFGVDDGSADLRLWRTDGTAKGTFPLPLSDRSAPHQVLAAGPIAFFNLENPDGSLSLWRTDGTVGGTIELAPGVAIGDDRLLFRADPPLFLFSAAFDNGGSDREPWVSDGTPEGTRLLRDLQPGPDLNTVADFTVFGNQVVFRGLDPASGTVALWRTDGTPEGTELAVAPDGASYTSVTAVGEALYLTGVGDRNHGLLWRSDGTAAGTVELEDFGGVDSEGGGLGASFLGAAADGRTVWVVDVFTSPLSLWGTDGTPGAAVRLTDLPRRLISSGVSLEGAVYFIKNDPAIGSELWRSDGTPEGTRVVVDFCPGACSGITNGPFQAGGRILVESADPALGIEPVVSDGTAEGTYLLADLCPGACSSSPVLFQDVNAGGLFLFTTTFPRGHSDLWASDLEPGSVRRLTDLRTVFLGARLGSGPGARIVFGADDGVHGVEPWVLPLPQEALDPLPPPGPWLTAPGLAGFEVKVRIHAGAVPLAGRLEPLCIPETLCVSGAVPGRSELFVRVVGPKPNGFLWPTLVKFSTSEIEVWVRQVATSEVAYYRLEGARPGLDELPGLFDRHGFRPPG